MPPKANRPQKPVGRYWRGHAPTVETEDAKKPSSSNAKNASVFDKPMNKVDAQATQSRRRAKAEPAVILKRAKAQPQIVKKRSTKDDSSDDSSSIELPKPAISQQLKPLMEKADASSSSSESDSEMERRRARARQKHQQRLKEEAQKKVDGSASDEEEEDDGEDNARALSAMLHGTVTGGGGSAARPGANTDSTRKAEVSAATGADAGDESAGDDSSSGSYEYETDSEELSDVAPVVTFRPKFVKKSERAKTAGTATAAELEEQRALEHEEKLQKLRREGAKKDLIEDLEAEAKARQSTVNKRVEEDDLDKDPETAEEAEAEYAAWRVRELARIKREMEERDTAAKEDAELARRRGMTDAEIEREDAEILAAQRTKTKPKHKFLQKYYHKGAFFRGGDEGDILEGRDFSAPTEEDRIDKSVLPAPMQVRRGFGLAGHTKYTHLADQDTTDKTALWFQDKNLSRNYKKKMSGMSGTTDEREAKRRRR